MLYKYISSIISNITDEFDREEFQFNIEMNEQSENEEPLAEIKDLLSKRKEGINGYRLLDINEIAKDNKSKQVTLQFFFTTIDHGCNRFDSYCQILFSSHVDYKSYENARTGMYWQKTVFTNTTDPTFPFEIRGYDLKFIRRIIKTDM
jgi:hypothetical protein